MTFHATNAITKEVGGPQYWTQIIDLKKIQYKQERALEKMALFIGAYKSDRISNLFQIYLGLNVLMAAEGFTSAVYCSARGFCLCEN